MSLAVKPKKRKRKRMKGKATQRDLGQERRIRRLEGEAKKNRPEMKYITREQNVLVMLNTGASIQYTNLAQGPDNDDRIGNVIKLWRIKGAINVEPNVAGAAGYQRFRLMLVKDTQPQSAAVIPALQDVIERYAGPVVRVPSVVNDDNSTRFILLWDKMGYVVNEAGAGPKMHFYTFNIPIKGSKVTYSSNVATSANNVDYYFIAYSDVAANGPIVTSQHRVFFTDA